LQLVRDGLLRSNGKLNVTTIALRYGFSHLGRFSAYYWATFGEMPSETLRHRRATLVARVWSRAFSSEVATGSRQENASNQKSTAPFRFHRNGRL
jgi:hypothetical protein